MAVKKIFNPLNRFGLDAITEVDDLENLLKNAKWVKLSLRDTGGNLFEIEVLMRYEDDKDEIEEDIGAYTPYGFDKPFIIGDLEL